VDKIDHSANTNHNSLSSGGPVPEQIHGSCARLETRG
jgi:hypothetical protein